MDKGDFVFVLGGDEIVESKSVEKEKPQIAYVPKAVTAPGVSLRTTPAEISYEFKITEMLVEYDFFETAKNKKGSFINDFVDNNDGTVIDKATG